MPDYSFTRSYSKLLKGVESTNNYIFSGKSENVMENKTYLLCIQASSFYAYDMQLLMFYSLFTNGVNTRHIVTVNMELGFSEIML